MLLERLFETHYSTTGFKPVQEPPTRSDQIRLISTTPEGSAMQPDAFTLVIEIVDMDRRVSLRAARAPEPEGLRYEYGAMRLLTAEGTVIPNPPKGDLDRARQILQANLDPSSRQTPTTEPRNG